MSEQTAIHSRGTRSECHALLFAVAVGCEASHTSKQCATEGCADDTVLAPQPDRAPAPEASPGHATLESSREPAPAVQDTKLLLSIDPTGPAVLEPLDPLFDIPVHDCSEPEVGCGLAQVCSDLDQRWTRQIERELGAIPGIEQEYAGRHYLERCEAPRVVDGDDFAAHAVVIRDSIAGNSVEGLLVETADRWRGLARISEHIGEGMGLLIEHHPIAAWQLDIDGVRGEELVLLVRGRDLGHATDKDPHVRARVIVCGTAPRSNEDHGPWCGRIEIGAWLDDAATRAVSEAQRRASWVGRLEIHAGGKLELIGEPPQHSRSLPLRDLDRADYPLISR